MRQTVVMKKRVNINGSSVYGSKSFLDQNTQFNYKMLTFFIWLNLLRRSSMNPSFLLFLKPFSLTSERHFENYERIFVFFKSNLIFLVFYSSNWVLHLIWRKLFFFQNQAPIQREKLEKNSVFFIKKSVNF